MAWPPPVQAINRTDATPQGPGTHANDHNAHALAINDIVSYIQALPIGSRVESGFVSKVDTLTPSPGIILGAAPAVLPYATWIEVRGVMGIGSSSANVTVIQAQIQGPSSSGPMSSSTASPGANTLINIPLLYSFAIPASGATGINITGTWAGANVYVSAILQWSRFRTA